MRSWIREVIGWLLLLLSLLLFYLCYLMLITHDVTEAWPVAFIGVIVFRGGIQLLKVAVAAQLWAEAQEGERVNRKIAPGASIPPRPRRP